MRRLLFFKSTIAMLCILLTLSSEAEEKKATMKDLVVIKYDFTPEECLKASSADLHRITNWALYLEANVNLEILGEKNKIIIPDIKRTDISFAEGIFSTAKFEITPLGGWYSLDLAIEQIKNLKKKLEPLQKMATKEEEFDISQLTIKYMQNRKSQVINVYELQHYDIFLLLKKYPIPIEIVERDQDYFQLNIRVDKK